MKNLDFVIAILSLISGYSKTKFIQAPFEPVEFYL